MNYNRLAEVLFPQIQQTPAELEKIYPPRELPPGTPVTRIGPSPTGFIHLGNLYNALIGERLAHQSGGVFFLRIEDTDAKREVAGAVPLILSAMDFFGVHFDEGAGVEGEQGNYGPYCQRQRKEIYQAVAKHLVRLGRAYPCFCTEAEVEALRERQQAAKENFGYYGAYAHCRSLTLEQILAKLTAGEPWVLRFLSEGSAENTVSVYDGIRGELQIQQNYQDFVLLKQDGIPTYHFAHVVDDHFMRTTHVVRGEEWLATLPMHVELFDTLDWQRPIYCHTAQLMKIDEESGARRKLSKRKDPELALSYYEEAGYLPQAVWEYLLTVLNSNFEEWRLAHPEAVLTAFPFTTEKMSTSGALFDLAKLEDISKEVVARQNPAAIAQQLLAWCRTYAPAFAELLARDMAYAETIIAIGKYDARPRKDIIAWKQAVEFLSFYYDETFLREDAFPDNVSPDLRRTLLTRYLETWDFADDNTAWFEKVRALSAEMGFAVKPKDYKKNPEQYQGSIVDVSNTIRLALTGRVNSPDLWQVSQVLGEERVRARIRAAMD